MKPNQRNPDTTISVIGAHTPSFMTILPDSRIHIIDVLRGFTLAGIIIIHMVEQYYAGMLPQSIQDSTSPTIIDQVVQGFAGIFIMGKFFMIFSFLFGLSFFIQFSKSENDKIFLLRFTWRLIILFLIGLLHHIHYRGDILTIYAMLGVGLLFCYRLPDRILLVFALLLILNIPSVITRVASGMLSPEGNMFTEQNEDELMQYYQTAKNGSYTNILELNLYALKDKMEFQVLSGRIYITFGLFLLGMYAGRKKLFENLVDKLPEVRKLLGWSWKTLIAAILVAGGVFGIPALMSVELPTYVNWGIGGLLYDVFNACLALMYTAGIVLLFHKQKWKTRLMSFYEVGRMGLTTYIMQSAFGVLIFYSYGLGLLSDVGATLSFILAIMLFIVQIILSKVWFRYFNYGFFEWLWRSLTYFRFASFRRRIPVALGEDYSTSS